MKKLELAKLQGFCPHGNNLDDCPICRNEEGIKDRQNIKSKPERVQAVADSKVLEQRRFLLSKDTEVRKTLDNFRAMYRELKNHYPSEVISMVLGGSHIKGYAITESDFDSILYIDSEDAIGRLDIADLKPQDALSEEDVQRLRDNPSAWYTTIDDPDRDSAAQDITKLTKEAVLVKYENLIKRGLDAHGLGGKDRHISVAVHLIDKEQILNYLQSEGYFKNTIVCFFELSLDKNINKWRELVITELEKQPDGREKWQTIMDELGEKERLEIHDKEILGPSTKPERHKKLYPTLDQARQYFLKNQQRPE